MIRHHLLIAFLGSCFAAVAWSANSKLDFPSTPPVEPKDAAKTFHVLDSFEMQLIAAEPLVTDPVAITYDADGRAYVCEMNDYPYTDKAAHKPSQENPTDAHIGRVRLLTDTDGDGTFDKATVFADGLSWPTGAACWKGGIFVTATPDVWYLKDTNDDGVADVRQKVFTGFKKLNVQAVMNNPIWGLDHRIYIAGGSNGGEIQRVPGSESVMPLPKDFKPLPIKRNDFSFDPSTGDARLESGGARFGNTFDDWGNRFLCNIRNPCQHVVLPYRYLARNPYLVVPSALNDCAEAGDQLPVYRTSPPEPWREFRAKRWVQEGSHLPKSELVGAGVVTSSSGITVYRGDAYPKEYRDFAFVADVAGNLFYRMKLVPDGVTFKAVQVDGKANFCTSDDLWFRPVNFVNAPDGCLHVCDMYREVIEHPWSIPDDIHTAVDLLRGRDRGRIWRLTPRGSVVPPSDGSDKAPAKAGTTKRVTPKLSQASTTDLVALLDHPNAWHRETAQRLLFERQDKEAVEPLRELVKSGKTAQGRITALWAMVAAATGQSGDLSQLAFDSLRDAFDSNDSRLVDQAAVISGEVRSAISLIQSSILMHQQTKLLERSGEQGQGILAAVFSLSDASDSQIATLAQSLLRIGSRDPWLAPVAINACLRAGVTKVATTAFDPRKEDTKQKMLLFPLIVEAAAQSADSKVAVEAMELPAALEGIERGMSDYPVVPSGFAEIAARSVPKGALKKGRKLADLPLSTACSAWWNKRIDTTSEKTLRDHEEIDESSLALVALASIDRFSPMLRNALSPSSASDLQLAALEALGSYREPAVADMLIDAWPKMTPALRDKATTILLLRTDRIAKLLDAIEAKKITPAQLSVAAKATLGRQKTPALAKRIAKLIGDGSSSNRKEVIAKYVAVMALTGDVARGSKVYETACMVCHKFADKGNDVGPHLGTINAWTAEQLVTNILDPNREVSPNFSLYLVETIDGRTLSGLIASETAGNLTLKRADGGTDTVLRSEIKSLTSPGISLMPEGLEAAITPQQMADLIAYLQAR
ncbi:MAG: c-type cytochrome [Prosthecobacter sp.]|jgi:putative membrane-bound dehydrogenase-like protein|uniref:PVC-type heme-binding CxxCH protein n=1 Tax=Prosthecobacter sp. TaxID=1965333 RepID=UPI0019E3EC58|nr:PVC-type heme-binding CxxCH protein [Prosthecobacter sp.]MBE2283746.1 c-type cytochrome [Prosthecobacter sp.]